MRRSSFTAYITPLIRQEAVIGKVMDRFASSCVVCLHLRTNVIAVRVKVNSSSSINNVHRCSLKWRLITNKQVEITCSPRQWRRFLSVFGEGFLSIRSKIIRCVTCKTRRMCFSPLFRIEHKRNLQVSNDLLASHFCPNEYDEWKAKVSFVSRSC